ncbi:MAG: rRNA adenine N-6-methyltransferase family protein [Actinomycetota bacterium]
MVSARRPPGSVPARRSWGWHQLEPAWADHLVELADLDAGSTVLDVGAGHGVITEALLRRGLRVIAIELHPERVRALRARFGDQATIVRADAADLRLPRRPFHVVANPPFAHTSALLRRLLSSGSRLQSSHLIVPKAVAQRWSGRKAPGAARWQRQWQTATGPAIPRRAFRPRPRVDTMVLSFTPRR